MHVSSAIIIICFCGVHVTPAVQGKNYIFSIKQTYRPVNPDGCSVVASKTKKNILITIAVSCNLLSILFCLLCFKWMA